MDRSVKIVSLLLWLRWLVLQLLFIVVMAVYASADTHTMTMPTGARAPWCCAMISAPAR